ncbi:MAG: hypothetical protein AAF485_21545 [Chloroflexota bacterium]
MKDGGTPDAWQNIIWREWRHSDDKIYAGFLFELVADTPVGWGTKLFITIFSGILGLTIGFLIGFIVTTNWTIIQQLLWAGTFVGAVGGVLAGYHLSWRHWLPRLAYGLPSKEPSVGLMTIFLLILLGSSIFGLMFAIIFIGMFWGMSGLLTWINKELGTIDLLIYKAWYFWWRKQPQSQDVEAALNQVYQTQPHLREDSRSVKAYRAQMD